MHKLVVLVKVCEELGGKEDPPHMRDLTIMAGLNYLDCIDVGNAVDVMMLDCLADAKRDAKVKEQAE